MRQGKENVETEKVCFSRCADSKVPGGICSEALRLERDGDGGR